MLNKQNRMLAGIGVAMAILALAGCKTSNSSTGGGGRSEGRKVDDKNITANLEKSLDSDPVYKFEGVEVQTFAGVVSLSGFVTIQGQKDRAQQIAQHTDGVSEVVNGITVKPMMPATARWSEESKIYAEPQNAVAPGTNNQINQGK
jgi:hypothetical protein